MTITVKNRRRGDSEEPNMDINYKAQQRERRTRDAQ